MNLYSVTDVGRKRKINQDYVYVSDKPVGNLPNLFVVADGMGGHNAGDFASSFAVRVVAVSYTHLDVYKRQDQYKKVIYLKHAREDVLIYVRDKLEQYMEINSGFHSMTIQFDIQ